MTPSGRLATLLAVGAICVWASFSALTPGSLAAQGRGVSKPPSDRLAQQAYDDFVTVRESAAMSSRLDNWKRKYSDEELEAIYSLLLQKLDSKKRLEFADSVDVPTRHDLRMEGGRAAWALEQLLRTTLPPIREESTLDDINKAVSQAFKQVMAHVSALRTKEVVNVGLLSPKQRLELAASTKTSAAVLSQLTDDADSDIRRAVAENPNTSIGDLVRLTQDANANVRAAASQNIRSSR